MGFAERVSTRDQRNGLFVIHRHTAEGLADIVCCEHRIGVTVRALGIDVNQTHLHRSKAFT